ncbi:hypothetical protein AURDEDRAFT_160668 [Auricularia subglabra TFB-10046 SS5]|nr:hypothetical protein AURDEDRAFT_160668 [Auricularia subglabra TFB-10046 SS5]
MAELRSPPRAARTFTTRRVSQGTRWHPYMRPSPENLSREEAERELARLLQMTPPQIPVAQRQREAAMQRLRIHLHALRTSLTRDRDVESIGKLMEKLTTEC